MTPKNQTPELTKDELITEMYKALCEPANFQLNSAHFTDSYELLSAVGKFKRDAENIGQDEWYCISITTKDGETNRDEIPERINDFEEAKEKFQNSILKYDSDKEVVEIFLETWNNKNKDSLPMAGEFIRGHFYDRERYPNGLCSWKETHYMLSQIIDKDRVEGFVGGMVEFAGEIDSYTTEFEKLHQNTKWDEDADWYEELDKFAAGKMD